MAGLLRLPPHLLSLGVLSFLPARDLANCHNVCPLPAAIPGDESRASVAEAAAWHRLHRLLRAREAEEDAGLSCAGRPALSVEAGGFFGGHADGGGVRHDIPVAAVEGESSGWTLAYQRPYSHRTKDSDLDRVPADATHVLVAALDGKSARFACAAWGPRDVVLQATHDDGFDGGPCPPGASGFGCCG